MSDPVWQRFLELHGEMPRQGPGDAESTGRAFAWLAELPEEPAVLDVGCGPGAQTLQLAELCGGRVTAVDTHLAYLGELAMEADRRRQADRIRLAAMDMERLGFAEPSFDLIWCEGAIYIMGFERGLRAWRPLLRPGGYIAVTEATWFRADPPAELTAFWHEGYPAMQDSEANLATVRAAGYRSLGHFRLPDSAWWTDYYEPLEGRIAELERRHPDDEAAQAVVAMERHEIALFRKYSEYYGYEFYVMQLDE